MRRRVVVAVVAAALSSCRGEQSSSNVGSAAPSAEMDLPSTEWKQPRDHLLAVGETAPDFVAVAHTGHRVRLSQFLAEPSVVYFYPADHTAGCTVEAQGIRDAWLQLRGKVGMVFGVSTDDAVSHRDFATEHDLPFLLLSDVDGAVASSFGVAITDGRAARVTFLVDRSRKVVKVWDSVDPETHAAQIEAALDELRK